VALRRFLISLAIAGALAAPASSQDNKGPFGGFKHDRTAPVEVTADALEVRQAEERAIFTGNVVAGQGTLRLTAAEVIVEYDEQKQSDSETGAITRLEAKGDVFLSNGAETAQGAWAEYNLETGQVRMRGDVVLTQGGNAGKGESLAIDLNTGIARLEGGSGRVALSFLAARGTPVTLPPACEEASLAATAAELAISDKYSLVCVPKGATN
jgi:lipopolysaccharide export system protein LptA